MVEAGAGHVQVAGFHRYRYVVPDEPMHTGSGLEIEFKRSAQIRRALAGCRHARTDVGKRNPACAGGKILAQVRRQAHAPSGARGKLGTGENLPAQLPIPLIPVAGASHRTKHVAVGKAEQGKS
jgi:hypothetical protein